MAKESVTNREFLEQLNKYELFNENCTGVLVTAHGQKFGCFKLYFSSSGFFEEFKGK